MITEEDSRLEASSPEALSAREWVRVSLVALGTAILTWIAVRVFVRLVRGFAFGAFVGVLVGHQPPVPWWMTDRGLAVVAVVVLTCQGILAWWVTGRVISGARRRRARRVALALALALGVLPPIVVGAVLSARADAREKANAARLRDFQQEEQRRTAARQEEERVRQLRYEARERAREQEDERFRRELDAEHSKAVKAVEAVEQRWRAAEQRRKAAEQRRKAAEQRRKAAETLEKARPAASSTP